MKKHCSDRESIGSKKRTAQMDQMMRGMCMKGRKKAGGGGNGNQ